jgi:hypothetical protein
MPSPNLKRMYAVAAILVVTVCLLFLGRDWAARRGLMRLQTRLQRHGIALQYGGFHWESWRQLAVTDLRLAGPHGFVLATDTLRVWTQPWAGLGFAAVEQVACPAMRLRRGRLGWDLQAFARPHSGSLALRVAQAGRPAPHDAVAGLHAQLHTWQADGAWHVSGALHAVALQHPRLAPGPVAITDAGLTLQLRPSGDQVWLERGSAARLGDWRVQLGGRYDAPKGAFTLHAQSALQPAADLLAVLPDAVKGSLCDARLGGFLGGSASAKLRIGDPGSLRLQAAIQDSGLALLAGGPDFGRYRVAAHARPQWSQVLPPTVLRAILLSEDAGFYTHRGFDVALIGSALVQDWSARRLARGGGTVSMQLMRHLFLHRDKQFARKLEEALLTLLAERAGLLDKSTQLDLYLDRVEWGPGIHGIAAACQYYFHCTPAALTLDQGLFLAAILPNPRLYRTLLLPDGSLGEFAQGYYDGMRWLLYLEGTVEEAELDRDYPVFAGIGMTERS